MQRGREKLKVAVPVPSHGVSRHTGTTSRGVLLYLRRGLAPQRRPLHTIARYCREFPSDALASLARGVGAAPAAPVRATASMRRQSLDLLFLEIFDTNSVCCESANTRSAHSTLRERCCESTTNQFPCRSEPRRTPPSTMRHATRRGKALVRTSDGGRSVMPDKSCHPCDHDDATKVSSGTRALILQLGC